MSSLPVELVEQIITDTWTLPMPWTDRGALHQRLRLVNKTWKAVAERVALAHVYVRTRRRDIERVQTRLAQRARLRRRSRARMART